MADVKANLGRPVWGSHQLYIIYEQAKFKSGLYDIEDDNIGSGLSFPPYNSLVDDEFDNIKAKYFHELRFTYYVENIAAKLKIAHYELFLQLHLGR